jgi:hypothetical protein
MRQHRNDSNDSGTRTSRVQEGSALGLQGCILHARNKLKIILLRFKKRFLRGRQSFFLQALEMGGYFIITLSVVFECSGDFRQEEADGKFQLRLRLR